MAGEPMMPELPAPGPAITKNGTPCQRCQLAKRPRCKQHPATIAAITQDNEILVQGTSGRDPHTIFFAPDAMLDPGEYMVVFQSFGQGDTDDAAQMKYSIPYRTWIDSVSLV